MNGGRLDGREVGFLDAGELGLPVGRCRGRIDANDTFEEAVEEGLDVSLVGAHRQQVFDGLFERHAGFPSNSTADIRLAILHDDVHLGTIDVGAQAQVVLSPLSAG